MQFICLSVLPMLLPNIIICPESWIARWKNNIHFLHGENILWLNCLLPSQSLPCVLHVRDVKWSWVYLKAEYKLASKWKVRRKAFSNDIQTLSAPKALAAGGMQHENEGIKAQDVTLPLLSGLRNFPGGLWGGGRCVARSQRVKARYASFKIQSLQLTF